MTTLLLIVWASVAVLIIIVLAMRPERTRHSWSELKRRDATAIIRREKLLGDIMALRRVILGLLLIVMTLAGLGTWQAVGVLLSILVWLVAGAVSRLTAVHRVAMKLYNAIEPWLLAVVERVWLFGWLFRTEKYVPHDQKLESAEQLVHLVETAGHVLSDDQQSIIVRGLGWHTTPVMSIMTPAKDIVSINYKELLGPLVLDDLHHSGHTQFPVVRGNGNTIIGVLDITQQLDATSGKKSETAEKAMSPQVLRIESDESLPAALHMLQKSHLHMLIVVDSDGKTVGIVTLADIAASLLGKNRGGVV